MTSLGTSHLLPADATLAVEAARALRSALPVEQLVVFGSRARGDAEVDSDLDLLVLLKGERSADATRQVWEVLWDVQMKSHVSLSPLVVSADQWRHGPYQATLLKQEVERDGVLL